MTPSQWEHAKRLFEATLSKRPEERAQFLEENCGADSSLRNQVVWLLDRNDSAGSFLEQPFLEQSDMAPSSVQANAVFPMGSVLLGRFRIMSLAGRGGMGEVYEAEDLELHDHVALKTIRSEFARDPGSIARFKHEVQLARRITHPNVIRLFDLFALPLEDDEGRRGVSAFVTMQFLPGRTLAEKVREVGHLQTNEVMAVAIQICSGLTAAHRAGVIHRDLKSGNVMLVALERSNPYAVIMDFGLALTTVAGGTSDRLTRAGALMGTLSYMAPEQLEGGVITPATDIYALGIVLHEMVTGALPFAGESPIVAAVQRFKQSPTSPRLVRPDLDAHWETVIQKCLDYYPERRYQTAEALEVDLMAIRARLNHGTHSSPPGFIEAIVPSLSKAVGRLEIVSSPPVIVDPLPSEVVRVRRRWLLAGGVAVLAAGLTLLIPLRRWRPVRQPAPVPVAILTSIPGLERSPSFSPDGNQIAFTWTPGYGQPTYIYVQMVGGISAERLCLTPKPGSNDNPSWSPDGRQIAFLRRHGASADILLISPLGGPERLLTSIEGLLDQGGSGSPSLDWSPDGRWIITRGRARTGEPDGLLLIDSGSGDKHLLAASLIGPPFGEADPAFSPDGRAIVFVRRFSESNAELCVWSISSSGQLMGKPRVLAKDRTYCFGHPRWTSDGQSIVYTCRRIQNDSTLWRIASTGGEPQQITMAGSVASVLGVTLARRCCRLAFESRVVDPNIWSVQLDRPFGHASRPHFLTGSSRQDGNAQLSPDGSRLTYFSDRSGLFQIWIAARDGSNPQQLTHFTGGLSGTPRWSPDNQSIMFDSTADGNPEIYVVDTSGRAPRRLTPPSSSNLRPSFSPDGKWIYFGSDRSGRFEIWRMRFSAAADAEQVTRHGGNVAFVSPDNRLIYYQKDYLAGPLYAMPLVGGEEFQVASNVILRAFFPARPGVYFIRPTKEHHVEIAFWNASSRQVRSVAPLGDVQVWLGLSVSADERSFVYSQRDRYESDLLLVENFQ